MQTTPFTRSTYRLRLRSGFSLIELTLVVAIIATVSAIAIPRFGGAIKRQRLSAAAWRIAADLNLAQSRANMTSSTVTVTFTFASNQYQIPGIPDLARPLKPYTVNLGEDPYKARLASTSFGGMTQTSGTSQISYSGFGLPGNGGSLTVSVGNDSKMISIDPVSGKAIVQ